MVSKEALKKDLNLLQINDYTVKGDLENLSKV